MKILKFDDYTNANVEPMNESFGTILGISVVLALVLGPTLSVGAFCAIDRLKDKIRFRPYIKGIMKLLAKYKDEIKNGGKCKNLKDLLMGENMDASKMKNITAFDYRNECKVIMNKSDFDKFCELTDAISEEMIKKLSQKHTQRYTIFDAIEDDEEEAEETIFDDEDDNHRSGSVVNNDDDDDDDDGEW